MENTNTSDPVEVGEFISIPIWKVEGMVIQTRAAMFGSESAIEVLLEVRIDDPAPRWYRLEPGTYEIL